MKKIFDILLMLVMFFTAFNHSNSLFNSIRLADITVVTSRNYSDIRERGGGINEEYKEEYKKWPTFLDLGYGVDGKVIFRNILFIKIPTSVIDNLKNKYFTSDEDTILYIKQTIEEYIGSGIFYILIDENNKIWKDPYPSTITVKK